MEPRQAVYKALALKRHWPSASHLDEEQTWAAWITAAEEWRAQQAKKAA
ncbi:MAG TPA: hypothetical protein VNH40_00780 [Gaiellaceae bacterium]|nr:hypothetical protein [Gaiellaceae bacterium]